MKFTMYHVLGKPVEFEHRELAQTEWREYADSLLKEKPKADDLEAWTKINDLLNVKEDEIREKYPSKVEVEVATLEDMYALSQLHGSITLCDEDEKPVLYIADKNAE
jgi:hypothetical protein